MEHYYSQPITRFAKMNHPAFCAKAYTDVDTESFCRNFVLALMDRQNYMIFETDIVSVIHALTGWKKDTIKKAIQGLVKREELVRTGHKKIQYNPYFANRVITFDQFRLGYIGRDAQFSKDELRIIEEIHRLTHIDHPFQTTEHTQRDEEMKQLIQKVDNLKEQNEKIMKALDFLMARAKGEDVQEAKTMLRLVKDGE